MEPILKNIVKLTSLANSLPQQEDQQQNQENVAEASSKSLKKNQKKLARKLFNQLVQTQKYLNPTNGKALDAMHQETLAKEEYLLPR